MAVICQKFCSRVAAGTFSPCNKHMKNFFRHISIIDKGNGISRDFMALLQTEISVDNFRFWRESQALRKFIDDQKYVKERHDILGPDLATAHFIVARGGSVKFWDIDHWFRLDDKGQHTMPIVKVDGIYLEAVDASGTNLAYPAMENFRDLKYLKYLNVSNCPHVDDWFLAKCYQLRDSLEVLDLSNCPLVTECGLACLHHLRHLQFLNLSFLPRIEFKDVTFLLVEEMLPGCEMTGVQFLPRGIDLGRQLTLKEPSTDKMLDNHSIQTAISVT